jgi:protein KRI1
VQEKYGNSKANGSKGAEAAESDDESSSESESEDDDGLLATEALDSEIAATLQAIRSKDPRVYQSETTFYSEYNPEADGEKQDKSKPMYLKDYHRRNLLEGQPDDDEDGDQPMTYAQEQEHLKNTIVGEMHAAADDDSSGSDDDGEDDFLVAKKREPVPEQNDASSRPAKPTVFDVEKADRDPEQFLDTFMNSRAWLSSDARSKPQPFESEDEDDDELAENFEQAYNFRFENPETANEQLRTHARDAAAKYSVRRDEPSSRKKTREAKRAKKAAEREEINAEKARLKKLKYDELEEKVQQIKKVAGLHKKDISMDQWAHLLDGDWEDKDWDAEMAKQFGDHYYADSKDNPKKPEWDDDIDIGDIVSDYSDEEKKRPTFDLSDDQSDHEDANGGMDDEDQNSGSDAAEDPSSSRAMTKKDRMRAQAEKKRQTRKERQLISQIVDQDLTLGLPESSKNPNFFRYRETSPTNYGLTALDILMAEDSQLNQYAGLKKLASFRDPEKKRKDKKKLGKKARLRLWRKETFGDVDGPDPSAFSKFAEIDDKPQDAPEDAVDIREGKKRKRRHKKKPASS